MVKWWNLDDWFTETLPAQQKLQYLKEQINRFDAIGIFKEENQSEPVAWSFRKSGKLEYTLILSIQLYIASAGVLLSSKCFS